MQQDKLVWHFPLPLLSKLQPVLPHILPLQLEGAVYIVDSPGFNVKPLPLLLSLRVIPGHIVSLQKFTKVNILENQIIFSKNSKILVLMLGYKKKSPTTRCFGNSSYMGMLVPRFETERDRVIVYVAYLSFLPAD